MRIAPKPKAGQQVSLEDLLSSKHVQVDKARSAKLTDGRSVPKDDAFIIESPDHYTLGAFLFEGDPFAIDVAKNSTPSLEEHGANGFSSANGIEWFQVLRKCYEASEKKEYATAAEQFKDMIEHIWDRAEQWGLNSQMQLNRVQLDEITHKGQLWTGTIVGRATGRDNELLHSPTDAQYGELCRMLFGTKETSAVNEVYVHFGGGAPFVEQNIDYPLPPRDPTKRRQQRNQFSIGPPKTSYRPWLKIGRIINKQEQPITKAFLSLRAVRYLPP